MEVDKFFYHCFPKLHEYIYMPEYMELYTKIYALYCIYLSIKTYTHAHTHKVYLHIAL